MALTLPTLWVWVLTYFVVQVWVLTHFVNCSGQEPYTAYYNITNQERLQFGKLTLFRRTESEVRHLQVDKTLEGNIIFIDGGSLKTTDGYTVQTLLHVGTISSFIQDHIDPANILLVQLNDHCLTRLSRNNLTVTDYVGLCGERGFRDGVGINARMAWPYSVIKYPFSNDSYLITEHGNSALRILDTGTKVVGTIYESESRLPMPSEMDWETSNNMCTSLLITTSSGISRMFLSSRIISELSGHQGTTVFKDGPIDQATYKSPQEVIQLLHEKIYLLADKDNYRLRLIDLENNKVSSICSGVTGDGEEGSIYQCQIKTPFSLLLIGNTLYVGTNGRIFTISVRKELDGIAQAPPENSNIKGNATRACSLPSAIGNPDSGEKPGAETIPPGNREGSTDSGKEEDQTDTPAPTSTSTEKIPWIVVGVLILLVLVLSTVCFVLCYKLRRVQEEYRGRRGAEIKRDTIRPTEESQGIPVVDIQESNKVKNLHESINIGSPCESVDDSKNIELSKCG